MRGVFAVQVPPFQDGAGAGVIWDHNDSGGGEIVLAAVEMEAFDIVRRNALILDDGRIGQGSGPLSNFRGRDNILMPMSDPLDDPCGLDVHKNRLIIWRVGRRQHANDGHLQRIDAIEVKEVFRRGHQRLPYPFAQLSGHLRANHRIPKQRQCPPFGEVGLAKVEVIQSRAHDAEAAGGKGGMQRDRDAQAAVPDRLNLSHRDRIRAFF